MPGPGQLSSEKALSEVLYIKYVMVLLNICFKTSIILCFKSSEMRSASDQVIRAICDSENI